MAYMTNTNEEDFGDLTAGADITVSHYSLIMNYGVAGEQVLAVGSLGTSRTYTTGDPLILPAGALDINLPNGNLVDDAVKSAYDAYLAGKTGGATLSLGTAAMTATGKTNEVPTNRGYGRQVVELTTGTGTAPTS